MDSIGDELKDKGLIKNYVQLAKGGKIKVGDTIFKAWFKNPENSLEKFHKVYVNAKTKVEAENKAKLIDADNFDHVSTPEQIFSKYQIKDIKSDNTPIYDEGGYMADGGELEYYLYWTDNEGDKHEAGYNSLEGIKEKIRKNDTFN